MTNNVEIVRLKKEIEQTKQDIRRANERVTVADSQSIFKAETTLSQLYRDSGGRYGKPRSVKHTMAEMRRRREDNREYRDPRWADYWVHVKLLCWRYQITPSFIDNPGAWT